VRAGSNRLESGKIALLSAGHLIHDAYPAILAPLIPLLKAKLGLSNALAGTLAVVAAVGGVLQIGLLDLDVPLAGHLVAAAALGVLGLPAVVVLDVALTLRLRARAALVPILALPVLMPQLIAATNASAAALAGEGPTSLAWSALLLAMAVVYGAIGLTIVPTAIE